MARLATTILALATASHAWNVRFVNGPDCDLGNAYYNYSGDGQSSCFLVGNSVEHCRYVYDGIDYDCDTGENRFVKTEIGMSVLPGTICFFGWNRWCFGDNQTSDANVCVNPDLAMQPTGAPDASFYAQCWDNVGRSLQQLESSRNGLDEFDGGRS